MREYVNDFMFSYINEFPESSNIVISIFSETDQMIRDMSEKEISATLKSNHINIEFATLNIILNFAMVKIEPKDIVDLIRRVDDAALDLYRYVNKLKLDKGYISKQQFDDNESLTTKLSLRSPLSGRL